MHSFNTNKKNLEHGNINNKNQFMRGKKDIKEQVEALQSQAKNVMNDTAVLVDERIQKAADIYRQAEK